MNSLILLGQVKNLQTDYEVASVDLSQEYWTPKEEGETRRLVYWTIEPHSCSFNGKTTELDCVVFIEPDANGNHKPVINGSKILLGMFENDRVAKGTPVEVVYRGKKKNKTNSNMSDSWSVYTLKPKGE